MIKIKENVAISFFTTTKVGGKAKYLVEVASCDEFLEALKYGERKGLDILIIGGGSNLIVSDGGYDGLVIINRYNFIKKDNGLITVGSGTYLSKVVLYSSKQNLSGLENLAGIPGTVGGAVYGNAGAYGSSVSDCVKKVRVYKNKKLVWIEKKDLNFSYRFSQFKVNKYPIIEVMLELKKSTNILEKTKKILVERWKKYNINTPCPGSYFKNIEVKNIDEEILKNIPPEKLSFGKIPAGYLLEEVGAKGLCKGDVCVSKEHANFFVSGKNAKAKDYIALAKTLKEKVRNKFGIHLEEEVQMAGFNKKVAILGFGLEGKDAYDYLKNSDKYEIDIYDLKDKKELSIDSKIDKKVNLYLGKDYLKKGLKEYDLVVRSPGFYRYHPVLLEAEKNGVKITSAVNIFFEKCPCKIIGVTGTKGKGTTSTLIYEILKKSGKNVYLAGNIGYPYLSLLKKLNEKSLVVMELSSFQLIDMEKSPYIAVVLNITEDHLDWHKNKEEYLESKLNIVKHQKENDFSVINYDYSKSRNFENYSKGEKYYFSSKRKIKGSYVKDGSIYLNVEGKDILIGLCKNLLLRGKHNWENITASICVSYLLGADIKSIKDIVFSFKGLEHRLELVEIKKKIAYYNDSFATGPQPTLAAIRAFDEEITLILGGYDKGLEYESFIKEISKKVNLKNVILIGDLAEKFYLLLKKYGYSGNIQKLGKSNMKSIVTIATRFTGLYGVVLLSPAAASFDMFKNYKERGNLYKKAVKELI